ncbi:MAG: oligosaccharide flippase family protein, partial [Bacteroidota bacterium]
MLRKLASQTAYYGLSSIIGRLLNYVLVPFHARVFSEGEYGMIADFYAQVAFLNVIYLYGMETTFFQFVSHKKQDQRNTFSLIFTSVLGTSLLFSSIIWLSSDTLAGWMQYPDSGLFVQWFALILLVDALATIPFARLRVQEKAKRFALLKVGQIVLTVLLNLFFLYVLRKVYLGEDFLFLKDTIFDVYDPEIGLGYTFLANLIPNALVLLFLLPEFRDYIPKFDWTRFKPMLVYAYPMIFTGLAYATNEVADRNLIKYLLPENFYVELDRMEAVGVYSGCYKLTIFITLATQAFKYAAEPFFFSKASDRNAPQTFARVMRYYVIACVLMIVAVSLEARLLADIVLGKESYQMGVVVVPFLLFANTFLGVYYNLSVWFKVTDRTYFGTFISLGGMFVTITLNVLLIPVLGFLGSAIATLACYGTMMISCYLLGQRYHPIPYPIKAILGYLSLAAALSALGYFVQLNNFWLDQGFRVLVFMGLLGLIYA